MLKLTWFSLCRYDSVGRRLLLLNFAEPRITGVLAMAGTYTLRGYVSHNCKDRMYRDCITFALQYMRLHVFVF